MKAIVYEDVHCYNAMRIMRVDDDFDVEAFIEEESLDGECINYAVIKGEFDIKNGSLDKT